MTLKKRNEALDALRAHYLGTAKNPGLILTLNAEHNAEIKALDAEWRQVRLDLPNAEG